MRYKKKSTFYISSAEKLDFENETFDLVISLTAIQNFEDLDKSFNEMKRVGKNKFVLTFLASVKNKNEIDKKIKEHFNLFESEFKIREIIESKDNIYFIY